MAKMSEHKVIVNVVHQDHPNGITTVSGETSSTSSSPSVCVLPVPANGNHGNSVPVSCGIAPILSREGLSALLLSYIGNQGFQVSRCNQPISASAHTAAVSQPRLQPQSSMQLTGTSNPLVTSRVSQPVVSSHKMNFNVKIINPLTRKNLKLMY